MSQTTSRVKDMETLFQMEKIARGLCDFTITSDNEVFLFNVRDLLNMRKRCCENYLNNKNSEHIDVENYLKLFKNINRNIRLFLMLNDNDL